MFIYKLILLTKYINLSQEDGCVLSCVWFWWV